jgi:intein/homing endonuclease
MGYKYATIDIETTGLNRYKDTITWIGIGLSKDIGSSVAIKTFNINDYSRKKECIKILKDLKESDTKIVWQNGKFDTLFIEYHFGIKLPINEDVMLLGTAYDLAEKHGLKYMAQKYLGVDDWDISKKEKTSDTSDKVRPYLRKDVLYTWELFCWFNENLTEQQWKVYKHILRPAYRMYRDVERNGIYVDIPALHSVKKKYKDLEAEADKRLKERYDINWNSSGQVAEVLFNKEGLPVIKKSEKTGKPSADASVLKKLTAKGYDLPKMILDYKAANTLNKMFLNRWEDDLGTDKRIHPSFNLTNVVSGRTSCLVGSTPVMVPGGYKPIKDIVAGDLVYSFNDELEPVLCEVSWSGCTGYRDDIVRVWYKTQGNRNTKYIDVTSDHLIRLIDGSYKRADSLIPKQGKKPGDHVLAIERGLKNNKRYQVYFSGHNSMLEHVFVYSQVYGVIPEHIHHIDHNPFNNVPRNLIGMTAKEHASYHISIRDAEWHAKGGKSSIKLRDKEYYKKQHDILMEKRCTKKEIIQALEKGNGIVGASKLLNRDYSFIKNRMDYYGIEYDGRKSSLKNNHVITKIEHLNISVPVYDITVPKTNCFIANGICVHNCQNPNLQQVPRTKDVRAIYKAPPGRLFFEADYSQLELRIAADYSNDQTMLKIYNEGGDIHTTTAKLMTNGREPTKEERGKAKAVSGIISRL